ncbi:DinB family protein [Chryseolinea sp. T2]|uniref:DinB family protein n=1 Tax=Chryseolinea sp. T2 TaxID=3129255 RepID=UPI0030776449
MIQPDLTTVPPFYQGYVNLVKNKDLFDNLEQSARITQQLLSTISESRGTYAYAPGKWTIKEVLCHMIDTERIFAYRAMRFARNDKTPLPGFEENDYAPEANAPNRTVVDIAAEMGRLRQTTIDLYRSFSTEMLQRTGTANNSAMSVLNLGFVISGHETHHRNVLSERYGVKS